MYGVEHLVFGDLQIRIIEIIHTQWNLSLSRVFLSYLLSKCMVVNMVHFGKIQNNISSSFITHKQLQDGVTTIAT